MNLLDKISNKSQLIVVALVVFSVFVGLGCISAADFDADNSQIATGELVHPIVHPICNMCNPFFIMPEKYNSGTGYHWEINPNKTYGVTLLTKKYVPDHPHMCGSSGTVYFKFLKESKDYYVQLDLISPTNKTVKSVNSTMLN